MKHLALFLLLVSPFVPLSAAQVASSQTATEDPSALPGVTLVGTVGQHVLITDATLQTLPRKTLSLRNAHTGVIETYEGVLLPALLARVDAPLGKKLHGTALAVYVDAAGSDGYHALYSLAEVDPSFHPGEILVADRVNGQPMGTKQGPFQLVNTEDRRPARWVHNLTSIHLIATE